MPDGIVVFDDQAVVVYANEAVESVWGWTPDELMGMSMAFLLHPEDVEAATASVQAFRDQGVRSRTPGRLRFRWPDDHYELLEVSGNPLRIDGHEALSLIHI